MLKQRLLTALVVIPIVAGLALFAPLGVVGAVLGLILLGAAWEWGAFNGWTSLTAKAAYAALLILLLLGCGLTLSIPNVAPGIAAAGVAWWVVAAAIIIVLAAGPAGAGIARGPDWPVAVVGLATLVPAWEAIIALRGFPDGPGLLFFLLGLTWVADSGAYAAGRLWGARRLAPRISPGKTWEGAAGGLMAAAIAGIGGGLFFGIPLAFFVPVCILTGIFSIIGDLAESLFKRRVGVKDSGTLFPGHGGVLDRFDSISAAAPVFYICLWAFAS
jgi:phosphatidate cytidylyltransferase